MGRGGRCWRAWRWRTSSRGAGRAAAAYSRHTAPAPPGYWTERDKIAWEKVDAKAKSFEKVTLDQISTRKALHRPRARSRHRSRRDLQPRLGRSIRQPHAPRSARVRRTGRRRSQRHGAEVRPRRSPDPHQGHEAREEGLRLVQDRAERLLGRGRGVRPDLNRPPLSRLPLGSRRADGPHSGQPRPLVPHRVHSPTRPLPDRTEQRAAQGRREAIPRNPRAAPGTARAATPDAERPRHRRRERSTDRRSRSPSRSSGR